jgi:hypothetical protein
MPNDPKRHLALVADPSPPGPSADDRVRSASGAPPVLRHPELLPVLSRAMSVVVDALELGRETPADVLGQLEEAAAGAMSEAYEPIVVAADRLARATAATRATEAASLQLRAEQMAALVAETASTLKMRQGRLADRLAEEAMAAARAAAASSVPGSKYDARRRAIHEADAVRVAAAARADQRADTAVVTAAAADQAEARLALDAERAAIAVERDATRAAAAVRATALDVLYEIAIDAACRRFDVLSNSHQSPHAP